MDEVDPVTATLLPLLIAVPLLVAGILVIIGRRARVHAATVLLIPCSSLTASIALVIAVQHGAVLAHGVGLWPVGIAIPLAADMFAALMLTVTSLLIAVCTAFALVCGHGSSRFFAPLVLVLAAGVNGALLTADLFNLFVFIEVMLLPSYGLFVLSARGQAPERRIAGTRLYVAVNLLTSTVFLAGVALIYGTTGTVNLGELGAAAKHDSRVALAGAVCLLALGIKAAVVPVHGWLAHTYPATSPAITALFSGLHTKVAIYAIYRIYAVLFDGDSRYLWIGVTLFSLTMIIGVLGAVGATTTRSILAFHMVSQIGYILFGVALFTEWGLTAGIFYLLHHMIVKASLFLSTGAIETHYGTGALGELSGIARREPWLAAAFFIAALSLAGLPPFSGFVAKLTLIMASLDAAQITATIIMIVVSLITLLSMIKIWSGIFWGPDDTRSPELDGTASTTLTVAPPRASLTLTAPAMILAALTLALGLGAELLMSLAHTAALGLLDPAAYLEAVTRP
ncbi:monovalent cation/H+ antiporter subunit D family protein [Dietzia maris]|uniref:Monovalent cation/H+ antiporter subunit D family protein n=1 Tax=Dietzia maris TaxID=37915 RepID=A0ABT8GXQ6_9ACTN|nr:monovalent cation/H+ antiporter subunit D family protein [Dietzia maris]MDN4504988.1 monovalent cation/H+ antiporter subunit D family protein [Dietzia maris]